MSTQRWDPFREMRTMREAMERLFQEGVVRPASSFIPGMRNSVPVDVIEREDGYLVRAALPGVRPDDVQVTLRGNLLTIFGEVSQATKPEEARGQRWLARECRLGTFYRTITLPVAVDADQTTAHFRHGMLELTLPKAEVQRAHRINIQATNTMNTTTPTSPNGNGSPSPNANATGASKPTGKSQPPRQDTPRGKTRSARDESHRDADQLPYDIVNEASEESFPASDAPSWTHNRD